MVEPKPTRASTAIGLCLALLAAALGVTWAAPAGADVEPAGPVTFTVAGGTIDIADGAVALCLEDGKTWDAATSSCVDDPAGPSGNPPSTLSGTVDADGNVTVPAANVVFPPLTLTDPLEIDVTIGSSEDVLGVIDPVAGTASMDLTLDIGLFIVLFATQCQLTLPMSLSGSYDQGTGAATLTDSTFAMPGASCPANPGLEPLINGQVGLPSASGSNAVTLVLAVDPVLVDDAGTDGGADGGSDDGGADGGSDDGGADGGSDDGGADGGSDDGGADGGSDDGGADEGADGEEEPTGTYLAAAVSDATYECRAADTASQGLLDLMTDGGFDRLVVNPTIRRDAVAPSPGPGDALSATFSMRLALPADLVDGVVGIGIGQVGLTDLTWTITPVAGVAGDPLVAHPPSQTIALVAGSPAVGQLGPVTGTFTRTSEIGEPVAFRSDRLTLTIQVQVGAAPIDVRLACDPTAGNVLSASDEEGTPPPPPPPIEPPAKPPVTPPSGGGPGAGGGPGGAEAPAGTHLPEVSSQATYACSITDPAVRSMIETLTGAPVDGLAVSPVLKMAAVSPSPAQGASFTATFSARLTLPSDIVDQVVGLGITQATISGVEWTIHPEAGVTGEPIVARPPAQQVTLAAGRPAGGDLGPFSGPITRTSAVGEPVSFRFDALTMTIGVTAFGQDLSVPLRCTPTAGNVLAAVDRAGTAVLGRSLLPATGAGDATRQLVVLALALLAAGFVLSGADAPVRARRRG